MEELRIYKLSEISKTITKGTTPSSIGEAFASTGVNYIKSEMITASKHISEIGMVYISEATHAKLKRSQLQANDILFSMAGAYLGKTAILREKDVPANTNQAVALIRTDPSICDADFIYYYLSQDCITKYVNASVGQSAQPNINLKQIGEIEVLLPSLEVQKKVAYLLSCIDNKIELNNRINHNLEEQARNIFLSYIEHDSTECYFSDMITIGSGGTPRTSESRFWNGKIPFFSPKDVSNSCFTLVTEKSITDDGLSNCNSNLYPENTTFITARGTVGKISLAGVPMAMNQSCFALTSRVHAPFFAYFLTDRVVESLKKKANGAVFDAINSKDIAQELVNVPNKDVILHVEDMICPYMNSIKSKSIENIFLIETREALLPRLMSGQLNINEIDS